MSTFPIKVYFYEMNMQVKTVSNCENVVKMMLSQGEAKNALSILYNST